MTLQTNPDRFAKILFLGRAKTMGVYLEGAYLCVWCRENSPRWIQQKRSGAVELGAFGRPASGGRALDSPIQFR